ncbi:hypothetical protein Tco_0231348 [Tanacetum coccineum]
MPTETELTLEQTQQEEWWSILYGSGGSLKMVVEVPDSGWLTRSTTTCLYSREKHKVIMKLKYMLQDFRILRYTHIFLEVSKCKVKENFKKDATLKLFRMVWQHVGQDRRKSTRWQSHRWRRIVLVDGSQDAQESLCNNSSLKEQAQSRSQ